MTSHDVRRMHQCVFCDGIGFYDLRECEPKSLVIVVSTIKFGHGRVYAHPNCYVHHRGLERLLLLSKSELDSIRLCDVSQRTMRAILGRKNPVRVKESGERPCVGDSRHRG